MEANKSKKRFAIIVIAIVLVVVIAGVSIFFAVKNASYDETNYGDVKYIEIESDNTLLISCSAPYLSANIKYEVDETKTATLSDITNENETKSYSVKIDKIEYLRSKTDKMKIGNILITATTDNEIEFKDGSKYEIEIFDGMIVEAKSKQSIGQIKKEFSVSKLNSKISTKLETKKNYNQTQETASCEAFFEKQNGQYFVVAKFSTSELTKLNEEALKNKETSISFAYENDGIKVEVIVENITAEYDKQTQTMTLKTPVDESKLFEGKEYVFYFAEGLIISPDAEKGLEYTKIKYTFMG